MIDSNHNIHFPVYNIKAISRLVGLSPITLRAWERRYGLPLPRRGDQGYRLYSEYDLRALRWIRSQLESGLSISRAVKYLNELRASGRDPAADNAVAVTDSTISPYTLVPQFRQALESFDDGMANEILRRAFALYSVDSVLMDIIQPTLIELGEAWHRGEMPIAVEHFATQFCMQHLNSMLASSAAPSRNGVIVAACAPGEAHQVGLLSLVVMLRWRGWDVKFLGPNLSLERLAEALAPIHPRLLLFTATLPETAHNLTGLSEILSDFPEPKPLIILGGQAFNHTRLPESIPAIYLNASPTLMVTAIEKRMTDPQNKD